MNIRYRYKLFLAGAGSVGKTTLLNWYTRGVFESQTMTIGIDFALHKIVTPWGESSLQIWDFGGQERFRELLPHLSKGSDAALLLFDVTRRDSFEEIPEWVSGLRENNENLPILLCGAKQDLIESDPDFRCASVDEMIKMESPEIESITPYL